MPVDIIMSQRKSFLGSSLGSLKNKLTRKSSMKSTKSPTDSQSHNPFADPFPANPNSAFDQPPAYSVTAPLAPAPPINVRPPSPAPSAAPSASSQLTVASLSTPEDPFAFLSSFDTVFLIDDSTSMRAGTRWREVKEVLRAITPICTAHDEDGIDVYFINHKNPLNREDGCGYNNIKSPAQVEDLFNRVVPKGGTSTGQRINDILKPYIDEFVRRTNACGDSENTGMKPVNLIVITDGEATDAPEERIPRLARRLDEKDAPPHQVGIQFFQVGDDPSAAANLEYLDDCLGPNHGVRDMVDTVSWNSSRGNSRKLTADGILKVVLGAVVRRIDRKQNPASVGRNNLRA